MAAGTSMLENGTRLIKRTKFGFSFYLLLIISIYFTICNLPHWKKMLFSDKRSSSGDAAKAWGNSLASSVMAKFSLPDITARSSSKGAVTKRYEPVSCSINTKPHRSIFYIKVHKTGSTTLRSMLLIYGREYNLTVCMDSMNLWGLNWPYPVDVDKLTKLKDEKCELIAEELVYSPQIVDTLMANNVLILASVRHPVKHFMSLYKYSKIQEAVERLVSKPLTKWDAMRIFLKNPRLVQNVYATYNEDEVRDKLQLNMVRPSLQLFSLGLTEGASEEEILEQLKQIHFTVVADHFDESMLVLREKLCCSVEDVVYRKQNVLQPSKDSTAVIPEDIQKLILEFNRGDAIFYKHSLKKLDEETQEHPNFDQLLGIYRHELDKYEKKCSMTNKEFPQDLKDRVCPPKESAQTGVFVEGVRMEQRESLLKKLRSKYRKNY